MAGRLRGAQDMTLFWFVAPWVSQSIGLIRRVSANLISGGWKTRSILANFSTLGVMMRLEGRSTGLKRTSYLSTENEAGIRYPAYRLQHPEFPGQETYLDVCNSVSGMDVPFPIELSPDKGFRGWSMRSACECSDGAKETSSTAVRPGLEAFAAGRHLTRLVNVIAKDLAAAFRSR